jgi:hypothetical protein
MDYDLKSSVEPVVGLNFGSIATDTTTVGNIIDSAGFASLVLTLATGTVTDGDYTLVVEHGDDSALSDATTVAATDLIGGLPSFTADTDDNLAKAVGYVGKKRYVRASIVSANTTSGAFIGVVAIKGHAISKPTA